MTTPFTLAPAAYPGAMPDALADWDAVAARFWIGQAGRMVELPSPDPSAYTAPESRGRVVQGLANNASGVTQFASATRTWGLSWQRLASRDFDRVKALDAGLYGDELLYVQPEDRNHLTLEQSMCGALSGSANGWFGVNLPTYDPTLTPPIDPSGVLRWTPASTADRLVANYGSSTVPSVDYACPYLPAESHSWSVWARATSAANTVTPQIVARDVIGNYLGAVTGVPVALSTSAWTQLQVAFAPNGFTSTPFVLPQLVPSSTAEIQVACAQFEYRNAATDWTAGGGLPRVALTADLPRQLDVFRNSQLTVTLAETVAGAA